MSDHRVSMGVSDPECDDGTTHTGVDWNETLAHFNCREPPVPVRNGIKAIEQCEQIPTGYMAPHYCMSDQIHYNSPLPTFGGHRPLWAKYGEYGFVPPQRWVHNLEHGAIVVLYHPCADSKQLSLLRSIVVNCIRRHIISVYKLLDRDRPFTLIAWGCRLTMNIVDKSTVVSFIKRRALKGPEGKVAADGQYAKNLLKKATVPKGSDYNDKVLCPQ